MAGSDPYGLVASGLPPELAAEYAGLTRQQAIAQALMQQSQQPLHAPEIKGRFQGRTSPLEGIAKIVQAYMASQGLGDVDKGYADLASRRASMATSAMQGYQQARDGAPAQNIPYPQGMTSDDEGNAMPAAVKDAVAGNPRAAITQALLNPLLAGNPLVTSDLKAQEKANEPYSLRPNQQRFIGGNVVATGQPEVATVTAAGPTGTPETRFVPKVAGAAPIPQPVRAEYRDIGGSVAPVPAFVNPGIPPEPIAKTISPDSQLHASVTARGQNMVDARTRELNGILEGQNIDTGPTANAIANYEIQLHPPPANSRPAALARYNSLLTQVKEINPDWNAPNYEMAQAGLKAFTSGKNGNITRSLSVAQAHLDTLLQAGEALNNGDSPAFNKLANLVAHQTGSPAPASFEAVKKIVGDEVVKAIVGSGGGVHDREAAAKTIDAQNNMAQLRGVVTRYKQLFGGQLDGLKRQYEQTTMRRDFDRFLSGQAKSLEAPSAPSSGGNVVDFNSLPP